MKYLFLPLLGVFLLPAYALADFTLDQTSPVFVEDGYLDVSRITVMEVNTSNYFQLETPEGMSECIDASTLGGSSFYIGASSGWDFLTDFTLLGDYTLREYTDSDCLDFVFSETVSLENEEEEPVPLPDLPEDIGEKTYMGAVLFYYWAWVMLFFFALLPVLVLVHTLIRWIIGIFKRANIYG